MSDRVVIKVDHISKTFRLPHERAGSIKNMLVGFAKRKRGYEIQKVLNNISFEIKDGDFFGIVGRNGSGKSTLLKILAGIYMPTEGSIAINGKLTPFIELGVGFNPDLTGRENVFLNGSLLGFNRKEMKAMYDSIVEFAELERFMDQKLKNYSSGMQVRLAFSIAIRANTPILLLDEVLAVGDEAFQKKCSNFFNDIKKDKSRTIVLVTHSMDSVRRYCDRAMLLEKGKIVTLGDPNEVADDYSKQFINTTATSTKKKHRYGTGEVVYQNIRHILTKEWFILDFDISNKTKNNYDSVTMGFDFCVDGDIIIGNDTRFMKNYKSGISLAANSKKHFTLKFPNNFGKHHFTLNTNITTENGVNVTDQLRPALEFDSNNIGFSDAWEVLSFPEITENDKD
jgi:ABC-type polysaccharide/polyol phosphate transport system ATPase subunit